MNTASRLSARDTSRVATASPDHNLQPLISKTREVLEQQQPNQHHLVYAIGRGTLHVRVSRRLIARALRICSAIIRGCEAKGWKIEPNDACGICRIRIGEDPVSFSIFEQTRRCEISMSLSKQPSLWQPRYRYKPTGLLALQICEHLPPELRRMWLDGRKQRLEDLLPEFVHKLEQVSAALGRRRLAHEEWNRRWRMLQRQQEHNIVRFKNETERRKDLLKQAVAWQEVSTLRQMICEVRRRSADQPTLWPSEKVERWLCWAEALVQNLDPFTNGHFELALTDAGRGATLDCNGHAQSATCLKPQIDLRHEFQFVGP